MRAISTVLDASLCLLLVSASAVTLAGTPVGDSTAGPAAASAGPDSADETAELLVTSTASVNYTGSADGSANTDNQTRSAHDTQTRTAHDTLAGLLASATHAETRRETANTTAFVSAVTEEVTRTLRRHTPADLGVQVVARTTGNATDRTQITVGATPPPETDVHAAGLELRRTEFTVRTWSA